SILESCKTTPIHHRHFHDHSHSVIPAIGAFLIPPVLLVVLIFAAHFVIIQIRDSYLSGYEIGGFCRLKLRSYAA
ncbi:hypothetical protein ACFL1X_11065, partial [Candidatus Hydrogenedentota bacterium]